MRLIYQQSIANMTANVKIPSGSYEAFLIHYSGTNSTATPAAKGDLGNIRLTYQGRQVQFVNIDRLMTINNLKGGAVLFTSVASDTLEAVAILPQAIPGDLMNVLFVNQAANAYLQLDFTALAALATGTVTIYGIERIGVQKYFHVLSNYDVSLGAGVQREKMPFENIFELFIENDSNLDRLHVFKDGETIVDASKTAMQALTNFENKIETYSESVDYIDVELAKTKQLDESLSDNVSIEYNTSGSATLNNVVSALDFSDQQMTVSEVNRNMKINSSLQRKTVAGHVRPVRVLGRFATGRPLA